MLKFVFVWLLCGGMVCSGMNALSQTSEYQKDSLAKALESAVGEERLPTLLEWLAMPGSGSDPANYSLALEALALSQQAASPEYVAKSHSALATQHYYMGNFDSSKIHQKRALASYQLANDSLGMAQVLNGLGVLLDVRGEIDSALHYYLRALRIRQTRGDQMGVSTTLNNIAFMYQYKEDFPRALLYFRKCLAIDTKIGNTDNLATTYSNIGSTHSKMGDFDLAIDFHKKGLALRRKTGNQLGISKSLNNIAVAYAEIGQNTTAVRFYEESLDLKRQLGNNYETVRTIANLGPMYALLDRPKQAIELIQEGIQMIDTTTLFPLKIKLFHELARSYENQRNYELAYFAKRTVDSLQVVLQLVEKEKNMASINAKFEALEREHEIETLKYQQNLNEEKMASYRFRTRVLWMVLVVIAGFSLLLFVLLYNNRRINKELKLANSQLADKNREVALKGKAIKEQSDLLNLKNQEILEINSNLEAKVAERTENLLQSNHELDTFLYQTSHALRAPLMRVSGLFSIVESETDPENIAQMQGLIGETIVGMDRMLYKLLEVQEAKLRTFDPIKLDLPQFVGDIFEELQELHGKADRLILDLPHEKVGVPDRLLFKVILTNLFENALQFRRPGTPLEIEVAISMLPEKILVQVKDNGIGIPKDEIPHVFDMFFRATHKSKGTGLGLYVVQKVVEKLSGKTRVESEEGRFTVVEVVLPGVSDAIEV